MRYLVDTHILIQWVQGDKKLKNTIREVLQNSLNQVFVSVISGIEIAIKTKTGKLKLKTSLKNLFKESSFEVLETKFSHALELNVLPAYHKDPFDRILISQAKAEGLTLITRDRKIWKYKIDLLKA